jgi:hypothetical protein
VTIRIDVDPGDLQIVIDRFSLGGRRMGGPYRYDTVERAVSLLLVFIGIERDNAEAARFIPQADVEARRIFKQFEERSPFNGRRSNGGKR